MAESDYYPAGADTPDAPWNQVDVPEKEFEITCSQSLSKTVTVITSNYIPGASGVDYEPDDEGGYCACGWHDPDDTSDTNWSEEYSGNGHCTPLELIEKYREELSEALKKLEEYGKSLRSKKPYWWIQRKRHLKWLIKECEGWIEDDTEYIKDSEDMGNLR